MKIEDILAALPSKEDVASAIGLEARSSATGDMLTAFGIFGTGMILGAGLALLFAPKAGHEIRHDIAERVGEKIYWDGAKGQFTSSRASELLSPTCRKGWEV